MKNLVYFLILFYLACPGMSYAQQSEESLVTYTNFLLYVPKEKPASGKFPLLLFLHGSGERGNDLNDVKKHGPPSFLDDTTNFPFVVVSPQCQKGRTWDAQSLLSLLDYVESMLPIDKSREYVTGLSMGGFGTWALAQAAPDRFAAIAPVCGGGDSLRLCTMRHLPVWVFHGEQDEAVPVYESERLAAGLQKLGSDVTFTKYPDLGHDSWTVTYANPQLYEWLLSHKKSSNTIVSLKKEQLKKYTGSYKYSDKETITVTTEDGKLYAKSSAANNKVQFVPFATNKFRISGEGLDDGEMYFDVDTKGNVKGLIVGRCDHTYCPKI